MSLPETSQTWSHTVSSGALASAFCCSSRRRTSEDFPLPVSMENGSVSVVYHRTFKPQGKMRRRVKDLRIASFSYLDTLGCRAQPDLSHNESVRLAVDSLLTQGLEAYHKILTTEGEVDFLSEQEKSYVLQNGKDGCTDSAADASDDQSESLSAFSETALTYKMTSAESDQTLTPRRQNGVTSTNQVQDEPAVQIYFPSDIKASGIKDVVRNFIREAKIALAVVMECFSDVELLCDILVACRKRNVSVHLLLDRSNLSQFVHMWQELELQDKNFPRFSVRSVVGNTYCARTGRRLTGRIAESFVISDWTKVLTGTYSFSWLSGQVHRCHAVLVKGSAVLPFHQEFHRLNSSSAPVPGFDTSMSVPQTLPLYIYNLVCVSQKDKDSDSEVQLTWTEDTHTANTQTPAKAEPGAKLQGTQPQQLDLAGDCVPGSSVGQAKDITQDSLTSTDTKSQEKSSNHNSSSSGPISDPLVSTIHSELSCLTITNRARQVPESIQQQIVPPLSRQDRPPCSKSYLEPEVAIGRGVECLATWQRQRYASLKVPRTAGRPNMPRRDWSCPPNFTPRVRLQSTCSQSLSPSVPVKKDRNVGFTSFLSHVKEHILKTHKTSCHRPQAQDQANRHCHQSHFLSHQGAESSVLAPARNITSARYKPGSMLLSPDLGAKLVTQHRPAARNSSMRGAYEARQQASQRLRLVPLRQSLSLNDRRHILQQVQEH